MILYVPIDTSSWMIDQLYKSGYELVFVMEE